MPISDYFAKTYADARGKFTAAARAAGAVTTLYELPGHKGPEGEVLAVDVATLGPDGASNALVLISGTHGVEGFCGSGCQVGYLTDRLHDALPPDTRSILIHALNPYGFAWLRRANEENVDLNRNFQDFAQALPGSTAYEEVHDLLVPPDWDGSGSQTADSALKNYIETRGLRGLLTAVQGGQYSRPNGLFFGGSRPAWSNEILRRILAEHLPMEVKRMAVIDLHTGLGPPGYGEPIYVGPADTNRDRVKTWFGPEVKDPSEGDSASAPITGSVPQAFLSLFPAVEVTPLSLEFGTLSLPSILTALRGDHWLHAIEGRETPLREEIKVRIREAFYIDTSQWKAAVYGRTADFVWRVARGLGRPQT